MRKLAAIQAFGHDDEPAMPSKSAMAYDRLREAIISMELAPGSVLVEKDLCARFGVSRTPLREALLRLQRESLVTAVPGDKTFVDKLVIGEVLQGHFVRRTLEAEVIGIAAQRYGAKADAAFAILLLQQEDAARRQDADQAFAVDNAFHRLICLTAGLPRVWTAIRDTTGQLDRARRQSFALPGYFREVVDEHRALIDRMRRRDGEGAHRLMAAHLDGNLVALRKLVARHPELVDGEPAEIDHVLPAADGDPPVRLPRARRARR